MTMQRALKWLFDPKIGSLFLAFLISGSSAIASPFRASDTAPGYRMPNQPAAESRDIWEANVKLDPIEEDRDKPDSRKITTKFPATLPLVCEMPEGGTSVVGSANYVEGNRAVTILHTVVELGDGDCKPIVKLDTCSLFDGKRQYFIKWRGDPVSMCWYLSGKHGSDAILVGDLSKKIPGRAPYKIACKETVPENEGSPVLVIGAGATNWKKSKIRYGKERLLAPGHTYGVQNSWDNLFLKYSNDTGPLTSGGAVLMKLGSKEMLVAIHRGDFLDGDLDMQAQKARLVDDHSRDDMLADPINNYSEGLMFGSEVGCE
jgi:hypothetical protein